MTFVTPEQAPVTPAPCRHKRRRRGPRCPSEPVNRQQDESRRPRAPRLQEATGSGWFPGCPGWAGVGPGVPDRWGGCQRLTPAPEPPPPRSGFRVPDQAGAPGPRTGCPPPRNRNSRCVFRVTGAPDRIDRCIGKSPCPPASPRGGPRLSFTTCAAFFTHFRGGNPAPAHRMGDFVSSGILAPVPGLVPYVAGGTPVAPPRAPELAHEMGQQVVTCVT